MKEGTENRRYWCTIEEASGYNGSSPQQGGEFSEPLPTPVKWQMSRRSFLKATGIGGLAVASASCWKVPVRKAIPYLIQPEEVTPGVPVFYSTFYWDGEELATLLVKCREGRPIKVEPHPRAPFGSTSAYVQASLVSLYDASRMRKPIINGEEKDWAETDGHLRQLLAGKRSVRVVTPTLMGGATEALWDEFVAGFEDGRRLTYDVTSASALLDVCEKVKGVRHLPYFHLDRADVLVGVEADFLGTWLAPAHFASLYAKRRHPSNMNVHYQFESLLTLTGANADRRIPIHPFMAEAVLMGLYSRVAQRAGVDAPPPLTLGNSLDLQLDEAAERLWAARPNALVITGLNSVPAQLFALLTNLLVGAEGTTLNLEQGLHLRKGNDQELIDLKRELDNRSVDVLIFYRVNPVYNYVFGDTLAESIKQAKQKGTIIIALTEKLHETAALADIAIPISNPYESWKDAQPTNDTYLVGQPVVRPLLGTRQAEDTLLKWMGRETTFYEYLRAWYRKNIAGERGSWLEFEAHWQKNVHDGYRQLSLSTQSKPLVFTPELSALILNSAREASILLEKAGHQCLVLYQKVPIRTGEQANNAWLQELPDPITRTTWGNYIVVGNGTARHLNIRDEQVLELKVLRAAGGSYQVRLPALVQPGVPENVLGVAVGYGRTGIGKVAEAVGQNAYPCGGWLSFGGKAYIDWRTSAVEVKPTSDKESIARVQTHHFAEGRPVVKETTLEEFRHNPWAGNEDRRHWLEKTKGKRTTIYPQREFLKHEWGMVIDLSLCIGCGACVAACNNENNVPPVGKKEVLRRHDMHWIRIDRYYSGNIDNPDVIFQPMLCQHCDHAPCENVCPVAATAQSTEGINQMAYNRCIGTRYCANNCPYKVRRFNWYDYTGADSFPLNERILPDGPFDSELARLVLNPDVVVRSRGVMEKCTFCIQRIQQAKLQAKMDNRPLQPGEVTTACQQACPTNAITFGDVKNEKETVVKKMKDEEGRLFFVLEELHTLPSVGYLVKVRNRPAQQQTDKQAHI